MIAFAERKSAADESGSRQAIVLALKVALSGSAKLAVAEPLLR
jgi:hypothetical protein